MSEVGVRLDKYFSEVKRELETSIPELGSKEFRQIRDRIRKQLKKKENEYMLVIRSLKIIIFGDWNTPTKRKKLNDAKTTLLKNGVYAQTIDDYYNMYRKGGLNQIQILETCCMNHQLMVFIDGESPGTITEQNYLSENYIFHGKVIFFIKQSKFDKLKNDPSQYIRMFPTIITYKGTDLLEKILIYSRFRIYRLADIIMKQSTTGRGLGSPSYKSWKERLRKIRR